MHYVVQTIYSVIKDFITFVLTSAGIIIAGRGLSTWRKQIKGTKEFEALYNLNYSLLKLRNAIKYVRNPAIWPSEQYQAIQYFKNKYPDKVEEENLEKNSSAYVYEMRWEKITNSYAKMESYLLAVEVLWGPEILEKIKPVKKKITELNIALKQYFQPKLKTVSSADIHKIIYDQSGEENEDVFSGDINKSIKDIADYLKQKIKQK